MGTREKGRTQIYLGPRGVSLEGSKRDLRIVCSVGGPRDNELEKKKKDKKKEEAERDKNIEGQRRILGVLEL